MNNTTILERIDENLTVGEVVAENYRTAEVFKKFNIDFCCGGGRSLMDTCEENEVDFQEVVGALKEIEAQKIKPEYDFENWNLTQLIDHIEEKHHTYVKEAIPIVSEYVLKVKNVHGENKPYVIDIADHFLALGAELKAHLHKEENILFPFVKQMEIAKKKGEKLQSPFGTIQNPISAMLHEHDQAGNELKTISKLTEAYTPPIDACATHMVLYGMLRDFEEDLMMHIHLENNILFPKAVAMEKELK